MKLQVAIIGSPGSGKTVLTAVLSRYLSAHSDNVYMNPKSVRRYTGDKVETGATISYINETLELLHGGKWATAGTTGDTKFELGFELHFGGNAYEMKLLDSAGEDLQALWLNYDRTVLSKFRQELCEYILSSNIVILIVNLDHFADTQSLTKRSENENVLKEVIDNLVEAGTCHYISVCFTAYDKYKAHIDQTCDGNFIDYLRGELPMFYRSYKRASEKVVCDYTEYGFGQKMIQLECIAVAPVIAQKPVPGIDSDKVGKPPVGFDVKNDQHSMGIKEIADWLCMCEQSERNWSRVAEEFEGKKERHNYIIHKISPIVIGAFAGGICGSLSVVSSHGFRYAVFNSLLFGAPIGAGIGFLAGDKLRVLIKKKDGLVFKKNREDSVTSRPTGTGKTIAFFVGGKLRVLIKQIKEEGQHDFIMYRIYPIVIGAFFGILNAHVLSTYGVVAFYSSLLFGASIGAGIGFLASNKLGGLIKKMEELVFKKNHVESVISRSTDTGETSAPPPSGTGETSTAPPCPSGTGEAAATSGSETFFD